MLNSNRGVNSVHRILVKSLIRASILPSKAHRIMKEQVGEFENVGCSKQDLKISKALKAFIKDSMHKCLLRILRQSKKCICLFILYMSYDQPASARWRCSVSRSIPQRLS